MVKVVNFKAFLKLVREEAEKAKISFVNGKVIFVPTPYFTKMQNAVIKYGNLNQLYDFAVQNFKGANVKALSERILKSKQPILNYKWALNVVGANALSHGKVVLEDKDPFLNMLYAANVPNANVREHEKLVLLSKEPLACFNFAYKVKGAHIPSHVRVIVEGTDEVAKNLLKENHEFLVKKFTESITPYKQRDKLRDALQSSTEFEFI